MLNFTKKSRLFSRVAVPRALGRRLGALLRTIGETV
jgi:hypothetical protein